MPASRSITITLSEDMNEFVEAKIGSGEFASESDVVVEALRCLAEEDAEFERWVEDEVVPALKTFEAKPSGSFTLEETRQRLEAHMNSADRREAVQAELDARIDDLVQRSDLTREEIIEDALKHGRSLAWQERWVAGVQAGIADADSGRFASEDEIAAVLGKHATP